MDVDRGESTHQREYVCGPILDGMGKFIVVKADMSQIDFHEVLFKQKVRPQFVTDVRGVVRYGQWNPQRSRHTGR